MLIDNAKQWYKFWSLRLNALGVFLLSMWFSFSPEIITWWHEHAIEYFPFLSAQVIKWIGLLLIISGQVARFVKQQELHNEENNT